VGRRSACQWWWLAREDVWRPCGVQDNGDEAGGGLERPGSGKLTAAAGSVWFFMAASRGGATRHEDGLPGWLLSVGSSAASRSGQQCK
jgi:hypothetical protein